MNNKRQIWPIAVALIILLVMFLTACARIDVSPPLFRLAEPPSRTVPGDYEVLWGRAVGWFDAHEAEIIELDEAAGLVSGRLALPAADGRIDCGTFHVDEVLTPPDIAKQADIRIKLHGRSAATPLVLVTVTGHYKLSVMSTYAARRITRSGPCVSRGGLEKQIFSFLKPPA